MNNGVCRQLFVNYTCECLDNSYSGRHCEIIATQIMIYQTISKSVASIAIIIMASVAIFLIIMDVLKYFFNIDVTRHEFERIRRRKYAKKKKPQPVAIRFIYVNPQPVTLPSETVIPITREVIV
jgi:hypothetical protein